MSKLDFYSLATDAQVAGLTVLAKKALEQWSLTNPEIWLLKYRENCVFGVRDTETDSQYVLRIHRPGYHSKAALRCEHVWMEALHQEGIKIPKVIASCDGRRLVPIKVEEVPEERQCDLMSWVNGEVLGHIEGGSYQPAIQVRNNHILAGQLMGKIHNQAANWNIPEGFERPTMDAQRLIGVAGYLGDFRLHPGLSSQQHAFLEQAAVEAMHELENFGKTPDRFSLTHGDFLPENLLIDKNELQIIDFNDCGFGWHMMDIATSLAFLVGEESYRPAYEGLVEGYRSVRELPDSHLEILPVFLLARALAYVAWAATRHETQTARELSPLLIAAAVSLAEDYLGESLLINSTRSSL